MNLTSFLANKCFEYLLDSGPGGTACSGSSLRPAPIVILPPWADPRRFRSNCDGCGLCMQQCEAGILVDGPDGYPMVDFSRGACSFCGACAESCPAGAFEYDKDSRPWNLKAVITKRCLARNKVVCRTCAEHCDEGAITVPRTKAANSFPSIQAEKCSGCGACYDSCPVRAITITSAVGRE